METKCPFWKKCGAAMPREYRAKRLFQPGDPQRDFISNVCCSDKYLECDHYKIRAYNPLSQKGN